MACPVLAQRADVPPKSIAGTAGDTGNPAFKSKVGMKKLWTWDEISEEWGDRLIEKKRKREIYNTGRRINLRIAQETTIKDALIVKMKNIQINPKYLPK